MQIYAKAHSDHEEIGTLDTTPLSPPERFKLMALRIGIFFTLAIVSVFIPVLHFILVPAFLVASVLAGISASRFTSKATGGSVKCPHCKAAIQFGEAPLSWPMSYVCQSCASSVKVYSESQKT